MLKSPLKDFLLNEYIAFFLITVLKLEAKMFSYGGRKIDSSKTIKVNNDKPPH